MKKIIRRYSSHKTGVRFSKINGNRKIDGMKERLAVLKPRCKTITVYGDHKDGDVIPGLKK